MTFKEIVEHNDWASVEPIFQRLYSDELSNVPGYEKVFSELKLLKAIKTDIIILFSKEWNKFDKLEYIHVSGYDRNKENPNNKTIETLAIEFSPWEEWLGMEIDKETLNSFSEIEILCHCLYEMTFFGFNQSKIKKKLDQINQE